MTNRMPLAQVREELTELVAEQIAHAEDCHERGPQSMEAEFRRVAEACEIAAQAVALVERLAVGNPWTCRFCGCPPDEIHADDCLWKQARVLAGEE